MFTIYGDMVSGNCLKVKYVADYLKLKYQWHAIDVVKGEAQSAEFKAINPAAQVPTVKFHRTGDILSQSNAIMLFLAEGSDLIPDTKWQKALMNQWLFWEQYSHETAVAVLRFHVLFNGVSQEDRDPKLVKKAIAALALMNEHLGNHDYFVGPRISLADVALYAYTQFAPDAGLSLDGMPHISAWLLRIKENLRLEG